MSTNQFPTLNSWVLQFWLFRKRDLFFLVQALFIGLNLLGKDVMYFSNLDFTIFELKTLFTHLG